MTYTEIKEKGEKKYYYRVKSVRKGEKVDKERVYLGGNLTKQELQEKEKKADETLLNIKSEKPENKKESKNFVKNTGLTTEKDEFSEWYTQLLQKAELIEYTNVSGTYVIRPRAFFIWESIKKYFNKKIKKDKVKNAYFPLLIPKSNLIKEQEHIKGFTPEVAWVTKSGDTELSEPLAIRPTSETIMYPAYSKWIRSWRDLPLKINQWSNIVRWEFSHPIPFLRTREFLWQEGHSAFATQKEAEEEVKKIQDLYADVYKDMYAVPVIKGKKTDKEKFAGANYTLTIETFLPSGKAIQAATSHMLGQNFAKAFNIKFLDKNEKEQHIWQTSWGITTRSIGIAIMMHSDNKGLVLSPKIAETQIIIVPIFDKKNKSTILNQAEEIKNQLTDFRTEIDDREDYSPGFKFNEWEMKGIPLRIEIGPRDLSQNQAIFVRRDDNKKQAVKLIDLKQQTKKTLENIHNSLYNKAKKFLEGNIIEAKNMQELITALNNKKLVKSYWDGSLKSENHIKDKTEGAKILCITDEKPPANVKCVYSGGKAQHTVYISKSY